ncbi:hypothetical protein [Cohnella soli]|uniref:Uncharacterized protein n=1 Tax=Cohnella soli TaxID=425005 RepID=A0ABW0I464_9BACL
MNDYVVLELSSEMNNKLIYDIDNLLVPRNGIEDYYRSSDLPKSRECFTLNNVPFQFPEISADRNDNLSCESKKIMIAKNKYSSIHFLCSGFPYYYNEKIILFFENQETEIIKIPFPAGNIGHRTRFMHENSNEEVLQARSLSENSMLYIHHSFSNILNDNKLIAIEFPDNPFCHIFAITLGSKASKHKSTSPEHSRPSSYTLMLESI